MKKKVIPGTAVGLALLVTCSTAYAWNYATHAYIAGKIGKALPVHNYNEMYGIMAPDILNEVFILMGNQTLRGYTHGIPLDSTAYPPNTPASEDFMNVWYSAFRSIKASAAYGFVAHNDAWGADFVAHWRALPTSDPAPPDPIPFPYSMPEGFTWQPPGYIIYLAMALDYGLEVGGVWEDMGMEDDYATRLMFCHNIVEYAGDLALKRHDPFIGKKLIWACDLRTPQFAKLLEDAFPSDYDEFVAAAEPEYREMLMQYGLILLLPEETAIEILADQLASLAIDYLEFIDPETDYDPMKPGLVQFGIQTLTISVDICENPADYGLPGYFPSYMQELEGVVVPWVEGQLITHGIFYWF